MEITTVHYQKLVNLGDYENERVGAWANVSADETAEEAIAHLTEWVLARIESKSAELAEERELNARLYTMRRDLTDLEGEMSRAKDKWERIVAFFKSRDIDLPTRWSSTDDNPF